MELHDKKWLGEERAYFIFQLVISHPGSKAGTPGRGLERKQGRGAAHWPAPHGLLSSFPTAPRTISPGVAPPTVNWAFPQSINNQENVLQAFPQTSLLGTFPQLRFLPLKLHYLVLVAMKLASTGPMP